MKKTAVTLVVMLLALFSHAQIQEGAVLLEGSLSYSSQTEEEENMDNYDKFTAETKDFIFRPSAGFMVSRTVMLGIRLGYEHSKSAVEFEDYYANGDETTTMNLISVGPYLKTFLPLNEKLYFTITGSVNFGFGTQTTVDHEFNDEETEADLDRFRTEVSPGLSYFVSPRWALTASFGQLYYAKEKFKIESSIDGGEDSTQEFSDGGLSLNVNTFSIGVQYFINNGD